MRNPIIGAFGATAFVAASTLATMSAAHAAQSTSDALAKLQAGELSEAYAKSDKKKNKRSVRFKNHYNNYSYRGPSRYYRRDDDGAVAAGIAGLAVGALVGGALAQQQAAPVYVNPSQSAVAYCSQRFRSYDPRSGTYLGYDGFRHRCP
jgi:opacity protein-like surface antigen